MPDDVNPDSEALKDGIEVTAERVGEHEIPIPEYALRSEEELVPAVDLGGIESRFARELTKKGFIPPSSEQRFRDEGRQGVLVLLERVIDVCRTHAPVREQQILQPDQPRLGGDPASEDGPVRIEQRLVGRAVPVADRLFLRRHVAQIAGQGHRFVVAEERDDPTAGRHGLPFQAVDEPEEARYVVTPVEQIPEKGDHGAAAGPAQFPVDEAGQLEQRNDAVELAVHISEHEHGVVAPEVDLRRRRLQPDPGSVESRGATGVVRLFRPVFQRDFGCPYPQPSRVCVSRFGPPLIDDSSVHDGPHQPGPLLLRQPAHFETAAGEPDMESVLPRETPTGLPRSRGRSGRWPHVAGSGRRGAAPPHSRDGDGTAQETGHPTPKLQGSNS